MTIWIGRDSNPDARTTIHIQATKFFSQKGYNSAPDVWLSPGASSHLRRFFEPQPLSRFEGMDPDDRDRRCGPSNWTGLSASTVGVGWVPSEVMKEEADEAHSWGTLA